MLHTPPPAPTALASRPDPPGPLAVATPTTRKLADASLSVNTRRAYLGALARLDAWRGAAPVDDALLAAYLGAIFEAGRAPATAALAVAAVRCRATLAGQPAPAGAATARVLGGFRRTAADRGRGQAAPLRADGLAAILATADRPRTDGRGVESPTTAHRRGRLDAVIASLLFMGGLRRSEVAAVRWADVTDATDGDGVLITVRTSKTNPEGDAADVRYLKNGPAKAIPHPSRRRRRRRPHGSGGRVVAATDSAPLHRGRPRRRHRGARDGAQWPGRARVRTDGARRVHHRSHAGRQLENRPPWSRTTRRARPLNAGPSPSICKGGDGGTAPTAKPQQNHVTQELTPRSHHGHTTVSGESNSGGRTRRTGHAKGHHSGINASNGQATN